MLQIYAKEFVEIGKFLLKQENSRHKGYIRIEKKRLEELLNRNAYDTSLNKLKLWKALRWIDTESDRHLTKRVYDGANQVYKPYIMMDFGVYEVLKTLV